MTDKKQKNATPLTATIHQARRLIRIVVGFAILLTGLLLIFLPGPAVVVIPIGLMILATEFVWAKKLMNRFGEKLDRLKNGAAKDRN